MKYFVQSSFVASSLMLSACGGGEATTAQPQPIAPASVAFTGTTENLSSPALVTETSATTRQLRRQNGSTVATWNISERPGYNTGGFLAFGGGANNPLLFEKTTAGGGRAEIAMIVNDTVTNPRTLGGKVTSVDGSMPQIGSATYSGDYVGFLTRSGPASNWGLTEAYITGDVMLNADFAAESVTGSITNRSRLSTTTGAALGNPSDISLGQVQFDQGNRGELTGGNVLPGNSRYVAQNGNLSGSWEVEFSGEGAQEALGTVSVSHNYLNGSGFVPDDYTERGVFTATKQ